MEASKAATGSIKLEKIPCRVGVLMMQVMGEYQEKTEAADLTMIPTQPEEDLETLADGRSLRQSPQQYLQIFSAGDKGVSDAGTSG